ncbi:tetratricopeptide repeat protein [Kitasatospora sp. NPDC049258]|uniref:tetratricopeptide repeat protein n=1 Tax=Kitasatospora sp. NPDC049258 TaxID=3155394 RepID=UPI00341AF086
MYGFETVAAQTTGTNWALIGPLIGAIVAIVGLLLAERHRKMESVQTVVDRSVDARIGQVFREFSEYESSARAALESSREMENQFQQRIEDSESLTNRLDELLGSGREAVSTLENSKAMIPALLLEHARASADIPTALGFLSSLANTPVASSDEFERGGDRAYKLRNYELALRLYERAVTVTPQNANATASLIRMRARLGRVPVQEAIKEISDLALAHPKGRTVLIEAANTCMDFDDFESLMTLCGKMLEISPRNTVAWRNLAIARGELNAQPDSVEDAYEKALNYIEPGPSESGDLANTAKAYVGFLTARRDFNKAREIIVQGLQANPGLEILLVLRGDLEVASSGDMNLAGWCYNEVANNGADPGIQLVAITKLEELAKRVNLMRRGIISTQSATGAPFSGYSQSTEGGERPPAAA